MHPGRAGDLLLPLRATSSCHRCRSRLVGGTVRSSQDAKSQLPRLDAVSILRQRNKIVRAPMFVHDACLPSAFAVAIGGKADIGSCTAHVRF
jgi:hypothetical protein